MNMTQLLERTDTIVIGGGQAGLSVGYFLKKRGIPFVILDAETRIGDAWRKRWDSLRLFSAARFDGLAGMPFPGNPHEFPTKDAMADYLESYAAHFKLPVRSSTRVDRLWRERDRFMISAGEKRFVAKRVIVAMSNFQQPKPPAFASEIAKDVVQLNVSEYKSPKQLRPGAVLVVGAGNSGAEIAIDVLRAGHATSLAGPDVGHVPFNVNSALFRHVISPLLFRVMFHRVLTLSTPMGRKVRPKMLNKGTPLIRQRPVDLQAAGVQRLPRVRGVIDGKPVLQDGQLLDVANIIWCTGFNAGLSWIDLPILDARGEPIHERGLVPSQPGLAFVGQHFMYAASSAMIHGVGRDAERIVETLAA